MLTFIFKDSSFICLFSKCVLCTHSMSWHLDKGGPKWPQRQQNRWIKYSRCYAVASVTENQKAVVRFPGALIPACSALGSSSHRFILHFVVPQVSARDGNHGDFPLIRLWFLVKEGVKMAAHLLHFLSHSQWFSRRWLVFSSLSFKLWKYENTEETWKIQNKVTYSHILQLFF